MKKLNSLFAAIFIAAAMVSCNMVEWDDIISLNVVPSLINKTPRVYPGGNAECSTINIPGLVKTTNRNNYIPSTDQFENGWPTGLLVMVYDDKSVSFQIDGSINFGDGKCYKVGAVIVKGSDASNVYNYTDLGGVTMDAGLVAPNNASGSPAGLSNLTFCFVECKEELIVAVKSWFWEKGDYPKDGWQFYGVSSGLVAFPTNTQWCGNALLGYNSYPGTTTFNINSGGIPVATVTVGNGKVIVTALDGRMLDRTYVYIGTLEDLQTKNLDSNGCPIYTNTEVWIANLVDGITQEFTP